MRSPIQLLMLPLVILASHTAVLGAQLQTTHADPRAEIGTPVSVRWNRLVPKFADESAARRREIRKAAVASGDSAALRRLAETPQPMLARVYAMLSVAQYAAATSARDNRSASADAAIASASAAALADQYTAVRPSIAQELGRDLEQARMRGGADAATAGQRLGEDAARLVTAWAPPPFILAAPFKGTIPTGPGMWYSAANIPPIGIFVAQSRAWLLDSNSQFRPKPPPAFDSPEFKAALDEVRRVARGRTPEQTAIAQRWNSVDPSARWNEIASDALIRHHMSDINAVRVLALLNVAVLDAVVACFEAKYHYWTIRPSQADTTLVLADSLSLPNFPSYPSAHACGGGAFEGVLSHFFPQERAQFAQIAEEAAMSRLYGGIHYRFDDDVGLALGRNVARWAVEREKRGALNAWRTSGEAPKP